MIKMVLTKMDLIKMVMKNDLGTNKIYKCIECNLKIDRDINGARGIFIKSITK